MLKHPWKKAKSKQCETKAINTIFVCFFISAVMFLFYFSFVSVVRISHSRNKTLKHFCSTRNLSVRLL